MYIARRVRKFHGITLLSNNFKEGDTVHRVWNDSKYGFDSKPFLFISAKQTPVRKEAVLFEDIVSKSIRTSRRYDEIWKVEKELPEDTTIPLNVMMTDEEYQKFANPYPKIVFQMIDIISKYGEIWKDEFGIDHIDDLPLQEAFNDLYENLKAGGIDFINNQLTNENVQKNTQSIPTETQESSDELLLL